METRNRANHRYPRFRLVEIAESLELNSGWNDLTLPETQLAALRKIVARLRQVAQVEEQYLRAPDVLELGGVRARFLGPAGTGRTIAAKVIASELNLDAFRMDLSHVVSKYIGETEKYLRRIFDAARHTGIMLFFDGADALLSKRSDVKHSHDRYANVEIGYLLACIERFPGLVILATSMSALIDQAFRRRFEFVVTFSQSEAW